MQRLSSATKAREKSGSGSGTRPGADLNQKIRLVTSHSQAVKFEVDEEKAIAAVKLGFKFHRLSEGMLCREFLDAIAQDILSLQNNV